MSITFLFTMGLGNDHMILVAPSPQDAQEDDQKNTEGALVEENRSASVPTTRTEETYIGGWQRRSRDS